MPRKIVVFLGKFLLYYAIFLGLWYVSIPFYNTLLAHSVGRVFPAFDSLGALQSLETVPKMEGEEEQYLNEFKFTVKNMTKGGFFDGTRFHFDIVILGVLVLAAVPAPLTKRLKILFLSLVILFIWHNIAIFIYLKWTFACDMDGRAFDFFSSRNFSGFERGLYQLLKKLILPGTRIIPVALWLFFFFRCGGKVPFLQKGAGEKKSLKEIPVSSK